MPGGGHVQRHAAGIDRTIRALADSYGMSDVNSASPSRTNRAMPKVEPRVANGPVLTFAPGFSAPFSLSGLATCEPSRQRIDFKATLTPEVAIVPQQSRYPAIGASNWKTIRRLHK